MDAKELETIKWLGRKIDDVLARLISKKFRHERNEWGYRPDQAECERKLWLAVRLFFDRLVKNGAKLDMKDRDGACLFSIKDGDYSLLWQKTPRGREVSVSYTGLNGYPRFIFEDPDYPNCGFWQFLAID